MGGGGCSNTGHAYYLGMSYAFCGTSEEILGFQRAGTIEWEGSITDNLGTFQVKTGARPDPVSGNRIRSCSCFYLERS